MTRYIATPWRAKYVRSAGRLPGCIFCRALRAKDDAASFVVHRGEHFFVMLNRYPYTPGHLMIAPFRHTADFGSLPEAANAEWGELLRLSLRVLKKAYRPGGFNAGLNLGRTAGAGVVDHLHLHVVPRWAGDANFMPIVANARIFLEDLRETWGRVAPLFAAEAPRAAARGRRREGRPRP